MVRTKQPCSICGHLISTSNMSKHLARHERGHSVPAGVKIAKVIPESFICQFCGRICKNHNSLINHERLCKQNPNAMKPTGFVGKSQIGRTAWNKGLTKEADARVAKNTESVKAYYETHTGSWLGKQHTAESKRKIALSVAGNTRGNLSKKGYYKGIYCGSSYELAYVIYNLDHNIVFTRCDRYYEYDYKGKKHLYFPDFELNDGTIIEVKGYHTDLVDIKAAAVNDRAIKVLYKKDLQAQLNYVCNTYNVTEKTIYTLFENNRA